MAIEFYRVTPKADFRADGTWGYSATCEAAVDTVLAGDDQLREMSFRLGDVVSTTDIIAQSAMERCAGWERLTQAPPGPVRNLDLEFARHRQAARPQAFRWRANYAAGLADWSASRPPKRDPMGGPP